MAGPNLELFKFSLYLFFPLAIMVHYGDPQWYHDNVLPVRDRFMSPERGQYKPPRNAADAKAELAERRAARLAGRTGKGQADGEMPASSIAGPIPSRGSRQEDAPSLRPGQSLGVVGQRSASPPPQHAQTSIRPRTWRETWDDATQRHVV